MPDITLVVLIYWVIGLHLEACLYTLFYRTMHLLSTNWIQRTVLSLKDTFLPQRNSNKTKYTQRTTTQCVIKAGMETLRRQVNSIW